MSSPGRASSITDDACDNAASLSPRPAATPPAITDESGTLIGFKIDIARLFTTDLLGRPDKIGLMIAQSDGCFSSVLSGCLVYKRSIKDIFELAVCI